MIKIKVEFWPRREEVCKNYQIRELHINDFLDWVTEDDNKKHMYNASEDQNMVYDSKDAFAAELKRCDDFYKELFMSYMKPVRYRFRVKRLTVDDFRYFFSCEFSNYENFQKNYFDFQIATDFEKLTYQVVDVEKLPIKNEMMF